MQLLSLSISGFKSFALPTKLTFAPGITAIVGPNGCGKSNIVDAIRWVLGEQRSSVLRGDRMENVIFNGTVTRKPMGMGEVKLALDNSQGLLSIPYGEIEVARRLYRDGTSEYLLNGTECRLKDISDLLRDSGMGPNLYSILELKMVEDILREDGEGRRALFEEAAGVATYKLRRRQAQQKLKQTEEDLVRLADILSEVERQVSSLKRQALRARRYQELSAQLRSLEIALFYREYRRLCSELQPLESAMHSASASSEAAKSTIRLEEARLVELRTAGVDVEREATAVRQRLASTVAEISTFEAEEAGLRAQLDAARQTIERAKREQDYLHEKRALLDMRRAEAETKRAGQHDALRDRDSRVEQTSVELAAAETALANIEALIQEQMRSVVDLRKRVADERLAATDLELRKAGAESRREHLAREIAAIADETHTVDTAYAELENQTAVLAEKERFLRESNNKILTVITQHSEDLKTLEERDRALASLQESTQSKLELLTTLEERGPRSHSALRTLKTKPIEGLLELLGDTVVVDEKYRRAFQAVLGPAAYYYLTENVESALAAMEMLRRENAGQTTFLPISEFQTESSQFLDVPEGAIGTAMSLLKEPARDPVIAHFLQRVVVVNDWETALEKYDWARVHGCTLVTLDGQWISGWGLLRGGSEEAEAAVDLGLARQMTELRRALDGARADREQVSAEMRQQRSRLAALEQQRASLVRELEEITTQRMLHRDDQLRMETRRATLQERSRAAHAQIDELLYQIESDNRSLLSLGERRESLERESLEVEKSQQDRSRELSDAQRGVAELRDRRHAAERDRDAVKHQLELLDLELDRLSQSSFDMDEQVRESRQNADKASADLVNFDQRMREVETALVERFRARDTQAAEADRMNSRLDEIRDETAAQEERLRTWRDAHASELEGERKIELEMARLRGERNALLANARSQVSIDLSSEDFTTQHPGALSVDVSPEIVQEHRQKIERLGPVNPLALEDYERENARLDLMLKQREDLLRAKRTLEETVTRINETAHARFLHTFEAVRANFQRLFQEFFGAGEADLMLSGPDLLDADVTLLANPSGKRLKSLSLMSGGEKTMTAIALLFALYQVKPSPFCVFDEVDAPLDDANIDRFNRVIRAHSDATQFILVTHNRRTMEIADNLYGVTMEEEGVSKLVSVRLLSAVS